MPESLRFEIRDEVAYVTFTTPDRLNSIDETRLAELADVVSALEADKVLKAAVFTGLDKPRVVLDVVKRTIHGGRGLPIRDAVALEIEAFAHYMSELPFAREGFRASMENREPAWLRGETPTP